MIFFIFQVQWQPCTELTLMLFCFLKKKENMTLQISLNLKVFRTVQLHSIILVILIFDKNIVTI